MGYRSLDGLAYVAIQTALSEGASFCDVRVDKRVVTRITAPSSGSWKTRQGIEQGMGFRSIYHGCQGFSSTTNLEENRVRQAATDATRHAKAVRSLRGYGEERPLTPARPVTDAEIVTTGSNPSETDLEEKFNLIRATLDAAKRAKVRTLITYVDSNTKRQITSTDGISVFSHVPEVYMIINSFSASNSGIVSANSNLGGKGGMEILDTDACVSAAESVALRAEQRAASRGIKSGKYTAVLGPQATGTFAHEVVGHCFEADLVNGKESVISGALGSQLGPQDLTVVDDPSEGRFWGSMRYDHEGVPVKRRLLVDRGLARDLVLSRETGSLLGHESNGGARSPNSLFIPCPRASLTYIERGATSREEIISGVTEGVLIENCKGATTETGSGSFQLLAGDAFWIQGGTVTHRVRCHSARGHLLSALFDAEKIGDDFSLFNGLCKKRAQTVGVTYGGPSIRLKELLIFGI